MKYKESLKSQELGRFWKNAKPRVLRKLMPLKDVQGDKGLFCAVFLKKALTEHALVFAKDIHYESDHRHTLEQS